MLLFQPHPPRNDTSPRSGKKSQQKSNTDKKENTGKNKKQDRYVENCVQNVRSVFCKNYLFLFGVVSLFNGHVVFRASLPASGSYPLI